MLSPTIGHPLAAQCTRSWWVRPVTGVRASQVSCVFLSMPASGAPVFDHPPLQGEGRTAEGSPGWGGGAAGDDGDAANAEAPSPPPGPLARACPGSSPGQAIPPAEPRCSEGSATVSSDRSRAGPTSVGGGEDRPSTRHLVTEGSPLGSGFIHQPRVSSSRPRDNSTVPSSASGPPSTTAQ